MAAYKSCYFFLYSVPKVMYSVLVPKVLTFSRNNGTIRVPKVTKVRFEKRGI